MFVLDNIGLIFAANESGVIGDGKKMPWHIPEDLQHFKKMTEGHVVVMGRKTWESIPEKFRPLPNRDNYVLSRNLDLRIEGATVVNKVAEILQLSIEAKALGKKVWIIGGGQVYQEFLPYASFVEWTFVKAGPSTGVKAPMGLDDGRRGIWWIESAKSFLAINKDTNLPVYCAFFSERRTPPTFDVLPESDQ